MVQYRFILISIYLFSLPLCFIFCASLILDHPPKAVHPPFIFSPQLDNHPQIISNGSQDIEFKKNLVEAAHFAFENYYNNCRKYDEFRPISTRCLNNYGFSVSLFESLETLYYLNMSDEFQKAKNQVLDFKFDNSEYIDFHEFWSRGIASLISIYQLSGDTSFLFKASQLADQVLSIKKGDFINMKFREPSNFVLGKQFLNNWLSGIPEIIVLSELIQKPLYFKFIEETISEDPNSFVYPTKENKKHKIEVIFNFFTTSFIKNANIINQLLTQNSKNHSAIFMANPNDLPIFSMSKKLFVNFRPSKIKSLPELTLSSQLFQFVKEIPSNLMNNLNNEKRFGDEKYMIGFHFKADEIFELAKRGKIDIVKNLTLNSLKEHRTKNGFCGTTTSSIGKTYPDDIQHTEFLGEWLKVGAMIACGYEFLFKKGIFNEYGHILKILN